MTVVNYFLSIESDLVLLCVLLRHVSLLKCNALNVFCTTLNTLFFFT